MTYNQAWGEYTKKFKYVYLYLYLQYKNSCVHVHVHVLKLFSVLAPCLVISHSLLYVDNHNNIITCNTLYTSKGVAVPFAIT